MPFLDLGDVRLFFTDDGEATGDAPPVLLVHGFTADSNDWCWQIPHLTRSHRVLAVDLRGHGASSAPPDGYSTEQLAGDLATLLGRLGVAQLVVVGHSMGASVVSVLAIEHPELVLGTVAVDPAYLIEDEVAGVLGPVIDDCDDAELVLLVQGIVRDAMDSPARDPALREWQVRRVATVAPHVLRTTLWNQVSGMALRSRSEPVLRRRAGPVLAFHSDPARARLEASLSTDPRSKVVTWKGSGHWLHQERAPEFNHLLSRWVAEL